MRWCSNSRGSLADVNTWLISFSIDFETAAIWILFLIPSKLFRSNSLLFVRVSFGTGFCWGWDVRVA
jgi:hypothetical protein